MTTNHWLLYLIYLIDSNDHHPEEVLVLGKLGHRWPGHGNSKLHPQVLIAAIEALIIINDIAHFICSFTFHFRFASLFPLNCFILHFTLFRHRLTLNWCKIIVHIYDKENFHHIELGSSRLHFINLMSIHKFNCSQEMISKKAEFEVISDY